ncbi:hypothetical protein NECID01_1064 [Nematocida sp. AWRm77]|nr:hypothetical protein NECID01_1064 [Nematocida sp. AWRm77]
MRSARHPLFLSSNELSACLRLVEKVKTHPVLLRELLANMQQHSMYKERCFSELMRACKGKGGSLLLMDGTGLRMLLALCVAFPDMANPDMLRECFQAQIEDRTVRLFLLKIGTFFVKKDAQIDLSLIVDSCFEKMFREDTETDYLFLELLYWLAQKNLLLQEQIQLLEQKASFSVPLVLAPKLVQLATAAPLQYKVPLEAVSLQNTGVYLRTLDALAMLACESTKDRVLSVCPGTEKEFTRIFTTFISKSTVVPDFEDCVTTKEELFSVSVVPRIKKLVSSAAPAHEVVEALRKLLHVQSM